ncbi:MAG: bifunctional (p)ppGpp synthetase/guanosine-3',5'-bis(diphosphate) 3'-pyrophosphohydrolase [Erysipelotrichaceae bacterium]|nr:bifunctional (p)ppGpp synthetase/guanosine-3',5'-bis(diphosphate) 3'-pyrophosphohydrolase [Erysipelotrichaceae bacterium]
MKEQYFDKALQFAIKAHRGQKRKWTTIPYILHPIEVCAIVATLSDDDEVLSAALLHDTVEDTDVTMEDIRANFSEKIAMLVESETENKRKDLPSDQTWKIRKQESLQRMAEMNDNDVKKLWLADKLSNIRACFRDYVHEGDDLWKKFNESDPAEQYWYYNSVLELTRDLHESNAWHEYKYYLNLIFGGIKHE